MGGVDEPVARIFAIDLFTGKNKSAVASDGASDTYGLFVTAFDLSLTCANSCRARGPMTALSSPSLRD